MSVKKGCHTIMNLVQTLILPTKRYGVLIPGLGLSHGDTQKNFQRRTKRNVVAILCTSFFVHVNLNQHLPEFEFRWADLRLCRKIEVLVVPQKLPWFSLPAAFTRNLKP